MDSDDAREMLAALLPRLRRLAAALTGSTGSGDELVAATLRRALAGLDSWPEGLRFDNWAFRLLSAVSEQPEWRARRGEGMQWRRDDRMILHNARLAVAELPPAQRLVLALVDIESLSYDEAAKTLEIPVSDLAVYLARARLGLARALGLDLDGSQEEERRAGTPDDLLVAGASGELAPQRLSQLQTELDASPSLRRRSAALHEAGLLAEEAFRDLLQEETPPWLVAEISSAQGGQAVPQGPAESRPERQRRPLSWSSRAILLSLAVLMGLLALLFLKAPALVELAGEQSFDAAAILAGQGGYLESKELVSALERRGSSEPHAISGGALRIFMSFQDAAGRYCRYYEALEEATGRGVIGIACRESGAWRNVLPVAASGVSLDALRPVAQGATRLEAALDRLQRQAPLLAEEELRLIRTGWPEAPR